MIRIWRRPIEFGLLTGFGLTAALLGKGGWRWAAWIAMAIPIALCLSYVFRSGVGRRKARTR